MNKSDRWVFQRRPWGWMVKLWHSKHVWIKILRVTGRTSLQSHALRKEYHLSFFKCRRVNVGEKHRMTAGLYLEVATGLQLEDDNTRYHDDYARN